MYINKALLAVAAAAAPALAGDVNVYFGQRGSEIKPDRPLKEYCERPGVDTITLAFITQGPEKDTQMNYPTTNFGPYCWAPTFTSEDGTKVSKFNSQCPSLNEGIAYCQSQGKKVYISIGGHWSAANDYTVSGPVKGAEFAQFVWRSFGPKQDDTTPRPFGDLVLDGFDFDIEKKFDDPSGYITMINTLRSLIGTGPQVITAAPECFIGSIADGTDHLFKMRSIIQQVKFDKIFVQFYNNPSCEATNGNEINFKAWRSFLATTPSNDAKIYIGLPAAPFDQETGFVEQSRVLQVADKYKDEAGFGGFMFWDLAEAKSYAVNKAITPIYEVVHNFLQPAVATTTTTTSAATTSPSTSPTTSTTTVTTTSAVIATTTSSLTTTTSSSFSTSATSSSSSLSSSSSSSSASATTTSVTSSVQPTTSSSSASSSSSQSTSPVQPTTSSSSSSSSQATTPVQPTSSSSSSSSSQATSSVQPTTSSSSSSSSQATSPVQPTSSSSSSSSSQATSPVQPTSSSSSSSSSQATTSGQPTSSSSLSSSSQATTSVQPTSSSASSSSSQSTSLVQPTTSSSSVQMTTSTIYSTLTSTITACAVTVTDCPSRLGQVTTVVVAVGTTVCPVDSLPKPTGGAGSGQPSGQGSGQGSSHGSSQGSGSSTSTGGGKAGETCTGAGCNLGIKVVDTGSSSSSGSGPGLDSGKGSGVTTIVKPSGVASPTGAAGCTGPNCPGSVTTIVKPTGTGGVASPTGAAGCTGPNCPGKTVTAGAARVAGGLLIPALLALGVFAL